MKAPGSAPRPAALRARRRTGAASVSQPPFRSLRFDGPGDVRLAADGEETTHAALPPDPYPILPDAGAGWRRPIGT